MTVKDKNAFVTGIYPFPENVDKKFFYEQEKQSNVVVLRHDFNIPAYCVQIRAFGYVRNNEEVLELLYFDNSIFNAETIIHHDDNVIILNLKYETHMDFVAYTLKDSEVKISLHPRVLSEEAAKTHKKHTQSPIRKLSDLHQLIPPGAATVLEYCTPNKHSRVTSNVYDWDIGWMLIVPLSDDTMVKACHLSSELGPYYALIVSTDGKYVEHFNLVRVSPEEIQFHFNYPVTGQIYLFSLTKPARVPVGGFPVNEIVAFAATGFSNNIRSDRQIPNQNIPAMLSRHLPATVRSVGRYSSENPFHSTEEYRYRVIRNYLTITFTMYEHTRQCRLHELDGDTIYYATVNNKGELILPSATLDQSNDMFYLTSERLVNGCTLILFTLEDEQIEKGKLSFIPDEIKKLVGSKMFDVVMYMNHHGYPTPYTVKYVCTKINTVTEILLPHRNMRDTLGWYEEFECPGPVATWLLSDLPDHNFCFYLIDLDGAIRLPEVEIEAVDRVCFSLRSGLISGTLICFGVKAGI